MTLNTWTLKGFMAIPLVGWLYALIGIVRPFEYRFLRIIWWIAISLVGGLHALQIPITLPIGKKHGLSPARTIYKTMLYGVSWWKPLRDGLISS